LLVIVGGSGMGSDGYQVYGKELSTSRRVILFDQRGTGRSRVKTLNNHSMEGDMQNNLKDIELLRIHLNIDKWDVLGSSDGARLGMEYLYKHPDRVDKLIISNAFGFTRVKNPNSERKEIPKNEMTDLELMIKEEIAKERKKEVISHAQMTRFTGALRARFQVYNKENIPKMMYWWLREATISEDIYIHPMPTERDWKKVRKRRAKMVEQFLLLKNPVLVIHGEQSFMNLTNAKRNAEIFPNSTLKIIENCGHTMFIDAPEEYFGSIHNFLEEKE